MEWQWSKKFEEWLKTRTEGRKCRIVIKTGVGNGKKFKYEKFIIGVN